MLIFKCIMVVQIHIFIDIEIRVLWLLLEHANSKSTFGFCEVLETLIHEKPKFYRIRKCFRTSEI